MYLQTIRPFSIRPSHVAMAGKKIEGTPDPEDVVTPPPRGSAPPNFSKIFQQLHLDPPPHYRGAKSFVALDFQGDPLPKWDVDCLRQITKLIVVNPVVTEDAGSYTLKKEWEETKTTPHVYMDVRVEKAGTDLKPVSFALGITKDNKEGIYYGQFVAKRRPGDAIDEYLLRPQILQRPEKAAQQTFRNRLLRLV